MNWKDFLDALRVILLGFIALLGVMALFWILNIIFPFTANAADHAIVSFNNAEHLTALQDSVVGVCDTTSDSCLVGYSNRVLCHRTTITCRLLVDVEVTEQTRTIPNAEHESVYTWERPLPYHVFDPPDSTKEAEWKKLNTKWLDKLSKTPELITIPGEAIIFYEEGD